MNKYIKYGLIVLGVVVIAWLGFLAGFASGHDWHPVEDNAFVEGYPNVNKEVAELGKNHPILVDMVTRVTTDFPGAHKLVDVVQYKSYVFLDICSSTKCSIYVYTWDGEWTYLEDYCYVCEE